MYATVACVIYACVRREREEKTGEEEAEKNIKMTRERDTVLVLCAKTSQDVQSPSLHVRLKSGYISGGVPFKVKT